LPGIGHGEQLEPQEVAWQEKSLPDMPSIDFSLFSFLHFILAFL